MRSHTMRLKYNDSEATERAETYLGWNAGTATHKYRL